MLVMRMTRNQRVMIGNTTIHVKSVGDSTVRLVIDAHEDVPVIREEALDVDIRQSGPNDRSEQ